MSASSHTRGHPFAKDQTRGVLAWLESFGRQVVNGRRVLDLEMSKVEQLTALRAAGFDVPGTLAVAGRAELMTAARKLPVPFIAKHNQGGKGLGVRRFDSHGEFDELPRRARTTSRRWTGSRCCRSTWWRPSRGSPGQRSSAASSVYAITADTARGGFQLCPADACAIGADGQPAAAEPSLFALRAGFDHPVIGRYVEFAAAHGIGIAGFEFIETADGRLVTYDINTTTNYNAEIEAVAPAPGAAGRGGLPRAGCWRRRSAAPRPEAGGTAMRFGYWMPIFGGWLRNVTDEGMPVSWPYLRDLAAQSEQDGFDLSLIAELNLNDIKGHRAPSLDCWTLAPAVAAATSTLELMLAVRPNYHSPVADGQGAVHPRRHRAGPDLAQRRLVLVEGRGGAVRRAVRRARRAVRAHPGVAGGRRAAADRGDRDPRRAALPARRCGARAQAVPAAAGLHGR